MVFERLASGSGEPQSPVVPYESSVVSAASVAASVGEVATMSYRAWKARAWQEISHSQIGKVWV